jgi:tight adherence protein C
MQRRQTEILKAMPFVVDLLALSTEAGLDFIGAIGRVVEKSKGNPLVEEFEQVLREIRVGSSRQDALREMGQRINMTEVNSFIAILISADQMGAPIGRVLRQQSEQIRAERMLRAEKAGAAAAQKLLLPIFLFVFPAVLMMVIGPLVLGMIYGGKT